MPRHHLAAVAAVTCASSLLGCSSDGEQVATVDDDEVAVAAEAGGCDLTSPGFEGDTTHIDPAEAPPAAELYDDRPAIGGPHFAEWLRAGVYDAPVEERAAVHNLEHGAVAVYHTPDLDEGEVAAIRAWATSRNDAGLLDERTGAGLLVAPYDGPLSAPVAFRAWGVTADCDGFETAFADGFVRDHFGTAGDAPEGNLGSDPSAVVGDTTDT